MLRAFLMVGAGGAAGSMARYAVNLLINRWYTLSFPLATFLVNVLGCFIIGLLFGIAEKQEWMQGSYLLLLATGFCGGFTTFSTFALESTALFSKGQNSVSLIYMLLSLFLGIILCKTGLWLTR